MWVKKVLLLVAQLCERHQQAFADTLTKSLSTASFTTAHQLDASVAMHIRDIHIDHFERHVVAWLIRERAV